MWDAVNIQYIFNSHLVISKFMYVKSDSESMRISALVESFDVMNSLSKYSKFHLIVLSWFFWILKQIIDIVISEDFFSFFITVSCNDSSSDFKIFFIWFMNVSMFMNFFLFLMMRSSLSRLFSIFNITLYDNSWDHNYNMLYFSYSNSFIQKFLT